MKEIFTEDPRQNDTPTITMTDGRKTYTVRLFFQEEGETLEEKIRKLVTREVVEGTYRPAGYSLNQ